MPWLGLILQDEPATNSDGRNPKQLEPHRARDYGHRPAEHDELENLHCQTFRDWGATRRLGRGPPTQETSGPLPSQRWGLVQKAIIPSISPVRGTREDWIHPQRSPLRRLQIPFGGPNTCDRVLYEMVGSKATTTIIEENITTFVWKSIIC